MRSPTPRRALLLIFAVALLLRVGVAARKGPAIEYPDGRKYALVAENLSAGRGFTLEPELPRKSFIAPGYPVFLAGCRLVASDNYVTFARYAQSLIGALLPVLLFALARRFTERGWALAAACAAAVYPPFVYYSSAILSEGVFLTLLCAAFALTSLGLAGGQPRPPRLVLAGLVWGLVILTRPAAGIMLIFAIAWLAFGRRMGRKRVAGALGLALGAALVIAPWAVRNSSIHGRFVPLSTQAGWTLYESLGPDATGGVAGAPEWALAMEKEGTAEAEVNARLLREALSYAAGHPARTLRLALVKEARTWSPLLRAAEYSRLGYQVVIAGAYVPVLLLALYARFKRRGRLDLLLIPPATVFLVHLAALGSVRYRAPAEPFLLIIAALGLRDLLRVRLPEPHKVLHLITRLIRGGAQENTVATVVGLREGGVFRAILATGPPIGPEGSMLPDVRALGIEPFIIPAMRRRVDPLLDALAFLRTYALLRRGRYAVIHTHSSKAGILGRAAAAVAGTPVVIHTIHGLPFHDYQPRVLNRLYKWLERLAAGWSTRIVTVSDEMAERSIDAGVAGEGKFVTVRSGMPVARFAEARGRAEEARERFGVPEGAVVVGTVARLFALKGHDLILDAMPAILAEHPGVVFLWVGDGAMRERLLARAEEMGVRSSLVLTGLLHPDDVPEAVACMDVLLHASLREGLARAIVQGQAAGIPVVCFDIDSADEVIENGVSGRLVRPGDAEGLGRSVCELLSDPEKMKRMGEEGKKRVLSTYTIEAMVESLSKLYLDLEAKTREENHPQCER